MVWCTPYVLDSIYPEVNCRPLSDTSWSGSPYAANSLLNTLMVAPAVADVMMATWSGYQL